MVYRTHQNGDDLWMVSYWVYQLNHHHTIITGQAALDFHQTSRSEELDRSHAPDQTSSLRILAPVLQWNGIKGGLENRLLMEVFIGKRHWKI